MPARRCGIHQGIDTDTAKDMVKSLKVSKLKVQAQIQGEQVRVIGKQRDDLQQAMAHLRAGDWGDRFSSPTSAIEVSPMFHCFKPTAP